MNPTQAMQQVHTIRRGLSEIVRRYEDQVPPRMIGELNAVIFEAIHEGNEKLEPGGAPHPTTEG